MRVLFILPDLLGGGAQRAVLDLLSALCPHRFHATLLLLKRQGVYWGEVPSHVRLEWIGETDRRLRYASYRLASKLIALTHEHDVVVAALELSPAYLAYFSTRLTRRPVIGWIHTSLGPYLREVPRYHRGLVRFVYPRLSHVVCPSAGALESARDVVGLAPSRACAIPNPVHRDRIRSMSEAQLPDWAASTLQLPIVVALGRLEPRKGYDALIRAHARIVERGLPHNLVILGEGEQRHELRTLAASLGVSTSVLMPGFCPNPYPILKRARVFALASHLEGLPIALVEALALGVPVVATDCVAGPAEILAGGRFGLLVPVNDDRKLADAIGRVLGDAALRHTLQRVGPERAREYAPRRVAQAWERLLLRVACGSR